MVISTFLSAPIMYVSVWLLTISWMDPKPLESALQNISFNISIVSLIALVSSALIIVKKKHGYCLIPSFFSSQIDSLWFWALKTQVIVIIMIITVAQITGSKLILLQTVPCSTSILTGYDW